MDATLCRQLPNEVIMKIINLATHAANQAYHTSRVEYSYGLKVWVRPWRKRGGRVIHSNRRCRTNPLKNVIQELDDLHRQAQFFFDKTQRKPLPKPWTYSQILVEIIRMNYEGEDISGPDFIVEYLEYLIDVDEEIDLIEQLAQTIALNDAFPLVEVDDDEDIELAPGHEGGLLAQLSLIGGG